ncbi:PsiF family protein [Pelomicrobium sp.]|uniref:PsiF family protein n=1 Tax=Pelomicrobium sp. TaxID=2815319 RepID=UPI002FDD9C33
MKNLASARNPILTTGRVLARGLILAAGLGLGATGFAAEDKPLTPQQQRMAECSKEAKAKGLSGDARKDFMRECLKAGKPAASRGASS